MPPDDKSRPELVGQANAYLQELLDKIEKKQTLTAAEKRFLLRTGRLPYKAILYPESLTPAERNRVRWMPPPDEVESTIRRVSGGRRSTPIEVFEAVLDNAAALSDEELALVTEGFHEPASIHERGVIRRWQNKFGRAADLAFAAVTNDVEARAHRATVDVFMAPDRLAQRMDREIAAATAAHPLETGADFDAYHANEMRLKEAASEKAKRLEEQDETLFALVKEEMKRMAAELDGP